jgi:hypothetical protein
MAAFAAMTVTKRRTERFEGKRMTYEPYQQEYDRWQASVSELCAARDAAQMAVAERNLDALGAPMKRFENAEANMAQAFDELWTAYKAVMSNGKR